MKLDISIGVDHITMFSVRIRYNFWPEDGGELCTRPTGMNKAARAARLTFELLGQKNAVGALRLKRMFRSV